MDEPPPPPSELDLEPEAPSRPSGPYSSGANPGAAGPYASGPAAGPYSSATAVPGTRAPLPRTYKQPRAQTRVSMVVLLLVVVALAGGTALREWRLSQHADAVRLAHGTRRASQRAHAQAAAGEAVRALDDRTVGAQQQATAWFLALSPADHAAAAETAMADGYNARERIGGSLDEAEAHLAAVPPDSPLSARVARDRREIESRRGRVELRDLAASRDLAVLARASTVTRDLAALQLAHGCAQLEGWRLLGPARDALELVCDRCSAPPPSRPPAPFARVACFDGTSSAH